MSEKSPQKKSCYELEKELALELEQAGHTCIEWKGINGKWFLRWCGHRNCTQHKEDSEAEEMQIRHNQALAQIRELRQQGHTCLALPDIYPAQFSWCQHSPCQNNL